MCTFINLFLLLDDFTNKIIFTTNNYLHLTFATRQKKALDTFSLCFSVSAMGVSVSCAGSLIDFLLCVDRVGEPSRAFFTDGDRDLDLDALRFLSKTKLFLWVL